MSRFPVLIVIGPGDKELDRVEDLLDSLAFHALLGCRTTVVFIVTGIGLIIWLSTT